ncbi:MAG: hypothetical protein RLN99_07525, partial [Kiloniellaceae bacterium]
MSLVAALIGAAVIGAVIAVVAQPLVMPYMPQGELASAPADEPDEIKAEPSAESTDAADAPAPDEGEPVALVNGKAVTESDLSAFIQQLPPQLQGQVQLLMPQILDQLVNNALSTQAGREAGLADDADVERRVGKIADLIIGQTYLTRAIDERVTEDKVEAAYQKFLEEN